MSNIVPKPKKSLEGTPDYKFKICIIGAESAGKTAIVERLISGEFNPDLTCDIGIYKPFRFDIGEYLCQLELWDTLGQEAYKCVPRSYFRQAVGCVLVFDLTEQKSFDELQFWLGQFRELASPKGIILLVGNKADLEDKRQVSADVAEQFAKDNLLNYIETSALNGQNILEVFQRLAKEIFDLVKSQKIFVDGTGHAVEKEEAEIDQANSQKKCC